MKLRVDFSRQPVARSVKHACATPSDLGPEAADYASPLPKIFLHRDGSLRSLARHSRWIVRDGALLLEAWQQSTLPPPPQSTLTLLLREELFSLIKPPWRPFFRPYSLAAAPVLPAMRANGLMVPVPASGFLEAGELARRLRQAAPGSRGRVILLGESGLEARAAARVARRELGDGYELRRVSWGELETVPALDRLKLVETAELSLVGDPCSTHRLLAWGVAPERGRAPSMPRSWISLSIRHGLAYADPREP
jgi:hypothetical protein